MLYATDITALCERRGERRKGRREEGRGKGEKGKEIGGRREGGKEGENDKRRGVGGKECGRGEREREGERADLVCRNYCSSSALNGVYMYLTIEDVVGCVLLELDVIHALSVPCFHRSMYSTQKFHCS